MYRTDVEAMPRELKEAILSKSELLENEDDITSFKSEEVINQFKVALSDIDLPDYWIIIFSSDIEFDVFYLVFETKLTDEQEKKLFTILPRELADCLGKNSLCEEYSVY